MGSFLVVETKFWAFGIQPITQKFNLSHLFVLDCYSSTLLSFFKVSNWDKDHIVQGVALLRTDPVSKVDVIMCNQGDENRRIIILCATRNQVTENQGNHLFNSQLKHVICAALGPNAWFPTPVLSFHKSEFSFVHVIELKLQLLVKMLLPMVVKKPVCRIACQ